MNYYSTPDAQITHFLTPKGEEVEVLDKSKGEVSICIRGWKPEPDYRTIPESYLDDAIRRGTLLINEERYRNIRKERQEESKPSDNWFRPASSDKPKKKRQGSGRPKHSLSSEKFIAELDAI